MAHYSQLSLRRLRTADSRLQQVFGRVILVFDNSILEGHRGEAAQNAAFDAGRSQLRFPRGNHNAYPSKAVDAAPWPLDWLDLKRFYAFGGFVIATAREMNITIRWGGDWDRDWTFTDQTFNDLVHFEIVE